MHYYTIYAIAVRLWEIVEYTAAKVSVIKNSRPGGPEGLAGQKARCARTQKA